MEWRTEASLGPFSGEQALRKQPVTGRQQPLAGNGFTDHAKFAGIAVIRTETIVISKSHIKWLRDRSKTHSRVHSRSHVHSACLAPKNKAYASRRSNRLRRQLNAAPHARGINVCGRYRG
jgi:hypothetical protein